MVPRLAMDLGKNKCPSGQQKAGDGATKVEMVDPNDRFERRTGPSGAKKDAGRDMGTPLLQKSRVSHLNSLQDIRPPGCGEIMEPSPVCGTEVTACNGKSARVVMFCLRKGTKCSANRAVPTERITFACQLSLLPVGCRSCRPTGDGSLAAELLDFTVFR